MAFLDLFKKKAKESVFKDEVRLRREMEEMKQLIPELSEALEVKFVQDKMYDKDIFLSIDKVISLMKEKDANSIFSFEKEVSFNDFSFKEDAAGVENKTWIAKDTFEKLKNMGIKKANINRDYPMLFKWKGYCILVAPRLID